MKPRAHLPPIPRIDTGRLQLRYWKPADVHILREALERNRAHLAPWMPWANGELEPLEEHMERLKHWRELCDQGRDYIRGVIDPSGERVIGGCGLHPRCGEGGLEIGCWIDGDETGRGLGTELAAALVRIGMDVARVQRIEIHTDVDHEISARIPRKLGFLEEGILRE
ncbi:MAG: RimJ/RimL family protein N-acetyltransferase [Planctomycetota bacterium]|jgi:RimJ/RimL family protein N-acetyltransferase